MPLDTQNKRASAISVGTLGRIYPDPDGSLASAEDRIQIGGLYVLAADEPPADPLTTGFASATGGNDIVYLNATAATGGTAPYTYQWYRSTDGGKGDAIVGATTREYSDEDVDNDTVYYYTLDVTDDVLDTESYTQVSALPRVANVDDRRRRRIFR